MSPRNKKVRTRHELILEVWNRLGSTDVGRRELREIQQAVGERFGEGAIDSPAAIARLLADEGAELRHPEVIEFDARWREFQLKNIAADSRRLDNSDSAKPLRLKKAESFIKGLEGLRDQSERAGDRQALQKVRDVAIEARRAAETWARDRRVAGPVRAEQTEIAEWLGVWLKTPNLFAEWLELRRRSAGFREQFVVENSP